MIEPTRETGVVEGADIQDSMQGNDRGTSPSGGTLAIVMIVGLFGGLGAAGWLLLSNGQLETDVGKALSKLLPFAVVWAGLVLGINQLLKATAGTAIKPHEIAQAKVYGRLLANWNALWPTLTTSVSIGYFTAVIAHQHRNALLAFVAVLILGVFGLAFITGQQLRSDTKLSEEVESEASSALATRPLLVLAYLVPVLLIVWLSSTQWH